MNLKTSLPTLLGGISLALLLACGGGGSAPSTPPPPPPPTTATGLAYTDPTSGTYQIKKNTALSTSTHLVLDIVGVGAPSGAALAFTLSTDTTRSSWAKVDATDVEYVQNGAVLTLGAAPQAIKGKVAGSVLQGIVGQKGTVGSVSLNGVLARVALDFKTGAPLGAASPSLSATKAQILQSDGTITTVTLTPGTLISN